MSPSLKLDGTKVLACSGACIPEVLDRLLRLDVICHHDVQVEELSDNAEDSEVCAGKQKHAHPEPRVTRWRGCRGSSDCGDEAYEHKCGCGSLIRRIDVPDVPQN